MLATVNELLCVFFRFSIQNHPITRSSAHIAGKEHFIPARNSALEPNMCFFCTCCPINFNWNSRTVETNQNPSNPVAHYRSVPTILTHFFRKSQSLVSNCCIWSDYVFHMRHSLATCFPHNTRTHCSIQSQRMSFSHVPSIRSHSDFNKFIQFFTDRKNPWNFVRVPDRHPFERHPATLGFMSWSHKRYQHVCHPIPAEFFQRLHVSSDVSSFRLVLFCCTEGSHAWIVTTTSLLLRKLNMNISRPFPNCGASVETHQLKKKNAWTTRNSQKEKNEWYLSCSKDGIEIPPNKIEWDHSPWQSFADVHCKSGIQEASRSPIHQIFKVATSC